MNKTLTTALLAVLGSAIATIGSSAPSTPPPIPGPGGVAIAIKAFLERQETGKTTAPLLAESAHDLEFAFAGDKLDQVKAGKQTAPSFLDVGYDGKPFCSRSTKQFVTQIDNLVASKEQDARVLTHKIGRIRANCQSAECSLAVVEFTRIYTVGGGKQMHVPMRATALMKYERTEGANFKIFHWHASSAK
tara:strand:- start:3863 stop:4432 length:570 start_codon:yes stop_codon:yes gene_type:complete